MGNASNLIRAGMFGAAVPAVALLCITLPGMVVNILLPLLYLGAVTAIAGTTAGLLTGWLWPQNTQPVAFVLGAAGVMGSFAAAFYLFNNEAQLSFRLGTIPWHLAYPVAQFAGGIFAQLLTLALMLMTQRLLSRGL